MKGGPGFRSKSAIDRLMASVVETLGPLGTPCWVSDYGINASGYTRVTVGDLRIMGHRVAYEHFVGPIPDGLELDHLCRIRNCVNPAHLEPVTTRENMRRGMAPGFVVLRTGICKSGRHSMDGAYVNRRTGLRRCRPCHLERTSAFYYSKKYPQQKDN